MPDQTACAHVWLPYGWIQDEHSYNVIDRCDLCGATRTGEQVPLAEVEAVQIDLGRPEGTR